MTAFRPTIFLLFPVFALRAQVYTNQNNAQGIQAVVNNNLHGAGVSAFDFNQDGWDDLTYCLDNAIKIYQNNSGTSQLVDFGFTVTDNAKHPVWVDYDNDGDMDFFVSQYMHPCKLYRNEGNLQFTDVTTQSGIAQENVPHFGSSWSDYDRDGDLDVYICVYIFIYTGQDIYNYYDKLYRNNGDGTFTDATLESGAYDGISLSFQSLWTDYNNDQWPDLYVINDELHPNRLYHNNGDGTFTEVGAASGSAIPLVDAMTASGADFNNDGWEDLFVSNTSLGACALLRNNCDGSFTDIALSAGTTLDVLAWAGCWFDFDLDRDPDLYVCEYNPLQPTQVNHFLVNYGNETFAEAGSIVFPFDFTNSYTTALCDHNKDGYPDLAVNNYQPHNASLWVNSGSDNHYLKISLEGVVSNRQAVDAKISVWSANTLQSRIVHCGENYMGQDSQYEIFGLKNFAVADTVFISWPSGHVDKYLNVQADMHHHYVEGTGQFNSIAALGSTTICAGDTVVLDAGNYDGYLWNTGDTTQFIMATDSGEYFVQVVSQFGFTSVSDTIAISMFNSPEFTATTDSVSCHGNADGSIIITCDQNISVLLNDSVTGTEIDSLAAGTYNLTVVNEMGCEVSGTVAIDEPPALDYDVTTEDVSCHSGNNGSAEIFIYGGTQPYSPYWTTDELYNLAAGEYEFSLADVNNCPLFIQFQIFEPAPLVLTIDEIDCSLLAANADGGIPPYEYLWIDAMSNTLSTDSIAETLPPGNYQCVVTDANYCTTQSEWILCTEIAENIAKPIATYPNPFSTRVFIDCDDARISEALVQQINGKMQWQVPVIKNCIDLEFLSSGLYMLKLINDATIAYTLIVKF